MKLINKTLSLIFSTRITGILLIVFAVAMAVATFIENDYGTETAKSLIYNAKWFEVVILLLGINFIGNIPKYNLVSLEKAPVLLLHLSFIVIILGAGITRYRGYEGLVTIKENQNTNRILSIESFLQLSAGNQKIVKNYTPKKLFMAQLGHNSINESYKFEDQKINLKLKKYIPRAQYILKDTTSGSNFIHIVISKDNQRNDFFLKQGERQNFYGVKIAFDTQVNLKDEVFIKSTDSMYNVTFPEETSYFSMLENKAGSYKANTLSPLKFKALSTIAGVPIVFNSIEKNKAKVITQKPEDTEVKNPESAIVLEVNAGNETKNITLFGGAGYMNPTTTVFINGLHLKLRYGSKPIQIPFHIGLKDFTLERYPGSDSPSAFYSDLEIIDGDKKEAHQIFMNHVLDYKGYRFFQSAYLPDESGTILSVNHDYWGTKVTYLGYILLGIGMFSSLFWKKFFSFKSEAI